MNDALLITHSRKPIDQVAAALQDAVVKHGFGLMATHDLKQTMAAKGVPFAKDCRIFEVCNPQHAKRVLEANMAISTALPCRISLYREGEETLLATFRPTALLGIFDAGAVATAADEVEATISAIMSEAAA